MPYELFTEKDESLGYSRETYSLWSTISSQWIFKNEPSYIANMKMACLGFTDKQINDHHNNARPIEEFQIFEIPREVWMAMAEKQNT
jgi:hypothetical protein